MQSGTTSFDQVKCSGLSVQGGGRKLLSLSGANNQERASVAQDGTLLAPMGTYPTSNNGTAYSATIPGYVPGRVYYVQLSAAISATSTLSVNGGAACELDDMTGTAISKASANAVLPVFQPDAVSNFLCLVKGGGNSESVYDYNLQCTQYGNDILWTYTATYNISDLAVDSSGFLYCASQDGINGSPTAGQSVIEKIDTNGNKIWSILCSTININRLAIDKSGYIYASFGYNTTGDVQKYNSDGSFLMSFSKSTYAMDIAVDKNGYVYVIYYDGSLTKFDPSGNVMWTVSNYFKRVAVDSNGFCYAMSGGSNGAIYKISPDGKAITGFASIAYPNAISVDQFDCVYVICNASSGIIIEKINPNGSVEWTFSNNSYGEKISVDSRGFVYATFMGNVMKLDLNGRTIWSSIGITPIPYSIISDSYGAVYVAAGTYTKTIYKMKGTDIYNLVK